MKQRSHRPQPQLCRPEWAASQKNRTRSRGAFTGIWGEERVPVYLCQGGGAMGSERLLRNGTKGFTNQPIGIKNGVAVGNRPGNGRDEVKG